MTHRLGIILLFAVSFTATAHGAPAVVVAKKPSLTCPQTEMGDAGLQGRYEKMWKQYSGSIDEASKKLQAEIEKQAKSATGSGNLDLALFWRGLAKQYDQTGELRWDDSSLKKTWKDRFGDVSYPADFGIAVKKASEAYTSAQQDLEKAYGELVVDFTRAENLEQALKIRGEIKALLSGGPDPTENRRSSTEDKSHPSREDTADLVKRRTGLWGDGSYDRATKTLTLRYDFRTADHLKDFIASPDGSVVAVERAQLVIKPRGVLTHRMEFKRVTLSGKVLLPKTQDEKRPGIRLGVSANRKVFAYGSGSIRTDDGWLDVGGIKAGEPSQFAFTVGTPEMRFASGGKQGVLACNLQIVGAPVLEGSDHGCVFSELVISGVPIDFWSEGFEE